MPPNLFPQPHAATPTYVAGIDPLLQNALEQARLSQARVVIHYGSQRVNGFVRHTASGFPILCARTKSRAGHLINERLISEIRLRTGRLLWRRTE